MLSCFYLVLDDWNSTMHVICIWSFHFQIKCILDGRTSHAPTKRPIPIRIYIMLLGHYYSILNWYCFSAIQCSGSWHSNMLLLVTVLQFQDKYTQAIRREGMWAPFGVRSIPSAWILMNSFSPHTHQISTTVWWITLGVKPFNWNCRHMEAALYSQNVVLSKRHMIQRFSLEKQIWLLSPQEYLQQWQDSTRWWLPEHWLQICLMLVEALIIWDESVRLNGYFVL